MNEYHIIIKQFEIQFSKSYTSHPRKEDVVYTSSPPPSFPNIENSLVRVVLVVACGYGQYMRLKP